MLLDENFFAGDVCSGGATSQDHHHHHQRVIPCSSSSPLCPPMVYRSQKHSRLALEQMNEMRSDGSLCDVTLVIGTVRINAHRLLLASCSSYFRAMFTSEMAESRQR